MTVLTVGICMLVLFKPIFGLSRPSTIVLKNNGFTNVVVAIHESIPEDKSLIDTLKNEMTKASKILYTATKQRAFLKEIKILLPSTWSNDGSYQTPTSENLAFADVIITDPIRGKRSIPQTRSYDGCGKQGVHVLLTKEFLTTPRADPYLANPAKFFVHAFAQFRWGVFQEYAEEGENVFYFSPSTGQPEAIRCTLMIRGLVQKNDAQHTICYSHLLADRQHVVASIDEKTGLYHSDCQWRPYPNHQRTKASIMDHQFIQELETFCGDDPKDYYTVHNSEAPSKHNRLCGHRSTWGVITETDDFKGGINAPVTLTDAQLTPTFIVMRATSRKRRAAVLIDPLLMNEGALSNTVQRAVEHLRHEASKTNLELSVLTETTDGIQEIYDKGNSQGVHEINIPGELSQFERYLSKVVKNESTDGNLLVITDSFTENMNQILVDKVKSGLKVAMVTNNSTEMINHHHEYFSLHNTGEHIGHTLLDRLRHVLLVENANTVVVCQEEFVLQGNEPISRTVDIDRTLVKQISFIFHFEEELPYIRITSPNGTIYGPESSVYSVDKASNLILYYFGHTELGTWLYTLSKSTILPLKVRASILSENIAEHEDPLVIRQSVKFADDNNTSVVLHVDATQGSSPLLSFNVTAKIETPDGTIDYLKLLDNGAGADTSKDDGIYSRIYIAPKQSGSYHVTFFVSSDGSETVFRKEETASIVNDEHNPVRKSVTKIPLDGKIQRQISGGTIFLLSSNDVIHDVIAPSRITDLRALKNVQYRQTIVLQLTAPGDDHDHGKPFLYELVVGCGVKDVRLFLNYLATEDYRGQGQVITETFEAHANGTETETLLWSAYGRQKPFVFAIRAVDEYGNKGKFSNLATA